MVSGRLWLAACIAGTRSCIAEKSLRESSDAAPAETSSFLQEGMQTKSIYAVDTSAIDFSHLDVSKGCLLRFDRKSQGLKMELGLKRKHNALAWATMTDNLDKTGWIDLQVGTATSGDSTNDLRMWAAGFLEGIITAPRISQFYSNAMQTLMRDDTNKAAYANIKHMLADAEKSLMRDSNAGFGYNTVENSDPYWKHVRYILFQMKGILDGYNTAAGANGVIGLAMNDMFILNSHPEMGELMEAYSPERMVKRRQFQLQAAQFLQREVSTQSAAAEGSDVSYVSTSEGGNEGAKKKLHESMKVFLGTRDNARVAGKGSGFNLLDQARDMFFGSPGNNATKTSGPVSSAEEARLAERFWEQKLMKTGHCSALVRVSPDNLDLLMGHTTWDDYAKMTRIFKYYDFGLDGAATKSPLIAMSSYPGVISSGDDFYLTQNGLAIASTSLEILNPEIYNRIPEAPANQKVPNFVHIMVANRMAQTGGHWAALFSERNSGIGNGQWLVVDYKMFKSKQEIPGGTLWVVEQIPGLIMKEDRSAKLTEGPKSVAGFNRPTFKEIRERTGHEDAARTYGDLYSLERSPRGQIFAEIQNAIESLRDMRLAMRRNEWPNEKFAGKPIDVALWGTPGHAISSRMDLDGIAFAPNGGIDAKVVSSALAQKMQVQAISGPTHQTQPVFQWQDAGGADIFPGWPHLGLPNKYDYKWVQMGPGTESAQLDDMDVTEENA